MLVSRCCRNLVYVESNIAQYYVCHMCNMACDVIDSSNFRGLENEPRNDREIEEVTHIA